MEKLPYLHGILVLPITVFDVEGEIDWEQTRRGIEFSVTCGATAISYPGGLGEFRALNESERKKGLEVAVDTVNGRVPVVAVGSAASTPVAIMYHKHAKENGAVACMTVPPDMGRYGGSEEIYRHYATLAEVVDIPIMLHNIPPPWGYAMSAELCIRMLSEIDGVNYIKEEATDPLRAISLIHAAKPKHLRSLLSSEAGVHLVDDALRGADGTMVGPEVVDCHVQLWEVIERRDWDHAWELYRQYLPILYFVEYHRNITGCKEVLKRRGVITSTRCRSAGYKPFTDDDHRACDALVKLVSPMFRVPLPAHA